MLNLFDPSGRKLTSVEQRRRPIAPRSQKSVRAMGATKVIPFSSFQCHQREDSVWANDLIPELTDYQTHVLPYPPPSSGWIAKPTRSHQSPHGAPRGPSESRKILTTRLCSSSSRFFPLIA